MELLRIYLSDYPNGEFLGYLFMFLVFVGSIGLIILLGRWANSLSNYKYKTQKGNETLPKPAPNFTRPKEDKETVSREQGKVQKDEKISIVLQPIQKSLYAKLLLDPKWKSKSEEIKRRDNFRCKACKGYLSLEVHHLKYSPNAMPWEVANEYLITLCKWCHEQAHRDSDYIRRQQDYMRYKPLPQPPTEAQIQEARMKGTIVANYVPNLDV